MQTIAVLGAGELAATLVRRLAEAERTRRIVLVDLDEGRARGKALDIAQSGPLEGFDVKVEGATRLEAVGYVDALVVADPPELEAGGPWSPPGERILGAIASLPEAVPVLVAGPHPALLVELAGERRGRERVMGSAALAAVAALRRRLAGELGVEPREITATVVGTPPHDLVALQDSVTIGGIPWERLRASGAARGRSTLVPRIPGPVALAAAAARVLAALQNDRPSVLPLVVRLQGEYGHRGPAVAVPVRVAGGRVQEVLEVPLQPVDRLAFDAAVERRRAARA